MKHSPLPQWKTSCNDALFSSPSDCAAKAATFERRITIRNAIEYVAGAFVFVLFSAGAVGAFYKSEFLIGAALLLIVLGVIVVMRELKRRASTLEQRPEDDGLTHLRRQYERQYQALRSVPIWYVGPFMPGLMMFYFAVAAGVARVVGWGDAIIGIAGPAAISFGLVGLVLFANWIGARNIKAKIEELDRLG